MKKWVRAVYQPCMPIGDNFSRITESERHINLSRRAACEGTVLLKNESELLPLKKGAKVAIFGKAQIDYVKGGFSKFFSRIFSPIKALAKRLHKSVGKILKKPEKRRENIENKSKIHLKLNKHLLYNLFDKKQNPVDKNFNE